MAINLLLILLLHAKYDLRGHDAFIRVLEMQVGIKSKGSGVLEQMCRHFLFVDFVLHVVSWLVNAQ